MWRRLGPMGGADEWLAGAGGWADRRETDRSAGRDSCAMSGPALLMWLLGGRLGDAVAACGRAGGRFVGGRRGG